LEPNLRQSLQLSKNGGVGGFSLKKYPSNPAHGHKAKNTPLIRLYISAWLLLAWISVQSIYLKKKL
jgi:hypothetical protein